MIIKRLRIYERKDKKEQYVIRDIRFENTLNFIASKSLENQNSIGKTTVLRIIDRCLGAGELGVGSADESDSEFKNVAQYIKENNVHAELTLLDNNKHEQIIIRPLTSKHYGIINGQEFNKDDFSIELKKLFFKGSGNYKKLSFRDMINQFIRIDTITSVQNLKDMPNYLYYIKGIKQASDYEFLRLYLFGFQDIEILNSIKQCKEKIKTNSDDISSLKRLLDNQDIFISGKNDISIKIKKLNDSNRELEKRIQNLDIVNNVVNDLDLINNDKVNIYTLRIEIDKNNRSIQFLEKIKSRFDKNNINKEDIQVIYNYIENFNKNLGEKLSKNFNEVVEFHSKMMSNEIEFIEESIVELNDEIKNNTKNLEEYINKVPVRNELILTTAKSMNENSIEIGKYKEQLEKIERVEKNEKNLTSELDNLETNKEQYGSDFEKKLAKFNEIFQKIHKFVYGVASNNEFYYSHDEKQKKGQQAESWGVKYRNPDVENANSEGTSAARIIIFNLAYYEFAKQYGLKRPMFIIHDSGVTTISQDIRENIYNYIVNNQIQVIIATLRQEELDTIMTEYTCEEEVNGKLQKLDLSQTNKLFRI